jgi:hypothetical protein
MVFLTATTIDARRAGIIAWPAAAAGAVLALLTPALWNGFPLIFSDTGGYLERPLTGTLELGRSAAYGLFLLFGAGLEFWPNVLAQAALVVWLIALTLRVNGLGGRPWLLLGIVVALALTTSLPWFAAQLMPDVLFPAGVLAFYLLAFGEDELTPAERAGLCATIAFGIVSHMALLALALGLVAALTLAALLRNFPRPRLIAATLAVAGGLLLAPLTNLIVTGQFALTPGGASFLFGRLVEDGIVTRYLDAQCPDPKLRICDHRDEISRGTDDWLWEYDSPFWKLGGWQGYSGEERRIILATLADQPLAHLATALAHSADQLISFATDVATDRGENAHAIGVIKDWMRPLLPDLLAARQQAAPFDIGPLNRIHVPVAALSILGLIGALALRRRLRLPPEAVALCATVVLALGLNAVICGVFSHSVDRYQSRLVSLAPLAMTILLVRRRAV